MTKFEPTFFSLGIDVVPRALGLCNREDKSQTAGCCDRAYWHYRTTDIANARMQEAGWLFALASKINRGDNPFFENLKLELWARNSWNFWLEMRNNDGSVVEVYPNERSFCATSFSAAAFIETVGLLGGADAWQKELEAASNTFEWLSSHTNEAVANQMAASVHALAGYAQLTGNENFQQAAINRLDETLNLADSQGLFPEYDGVDIGYQTITMSSLALAAGYIQNDDRLQEVLQTASDIMLDRCDESGRVDPAWNSRGTQFIYPHVFFVFKSEMVNRIAAGLKNGSQLRPTWMDDRYSIALATNYLLSVFELQKENKIS